MKKSAISFLPEYFDYYINLNPDVDLDEAFEKSIRQIDNIDVDQLKRIGLKTYEEGKWSVNKIIQHLTDWERIWCYRTLLAIRNEGHVPPGLDHTIMANNTNADFVQIDILIQELRAVRKATLAMYDTFDEDILESICHFSNNKMSILAMGFNIIGHQLHHFNIIEERYIPIDC